MAIKEICRMGNPVLREIAPDYPQDKIGSQEFKDLIEDLKDSMHHYGGIGIASPQIGVSTQVAIIQIDDENQRYETQEEVPLMIIVNPQITVLESSPQGFWEGCLSVPGLRGFVERPSAIKLDYTNENNEAMTLETDGFLATVIQHELDHLFGKLYLDHVKDMKLLSYNEEFEQFIAKENEEEEEED